MAKSALLLRYCKRTLVLSSQVCYKTTSELAPGKVALLHTHHMSYSPSCFHIARHSAGSMSTAFQLSEFVSTSNPDLAAELAQIQEFPASLHHCLIAGPPRR